MFSNTPHSQAFPFRGFYFEFLETYKSTNNRGNMDKGTFSNKINAQNFHFLPTVALSKGVTEKVEVEIYSSFKVHQ